MRFRGGSISFAISLSLEPKALTKLASAVERIGLHLGVWPQQDELRVWGITRNLPAFSLILEVILPGLMVVKQSPSVESGKFINIAVLQGDEIKIIDPQAAIGSVYPTLLTSLLEELASLGVRFVATTQNIDTDESNPMSRFMLHIFGAFAELEREMIRERVRAGVRNAKRNGKQLGRKRVVFDRSRVQELRDGGATMREIAATLKIGRGTVQRFLAQKPGESPSSNPLESLPATTA